MEQFMIKLCSHWYDPVSLPGFGSGSALKSDSAQALTVAC